MKTYVYIATSLDGFIARKDGDIDWLSKYEDPVIEDYGFNEFINKIDAFLIGRKTFDKVLSFDKWSYTKKVYVLTSTGKQVPEKLKGKVEFISSTPGNLLNQFRLEGYSGVYIDGGKTIQSFLKEDLIDEMIITTIPVLLGEGIPLFGSLKYELNFKHLETVVYQNGLVKSHYRRER